MQQTRFETGQLFPLNYLKGPGIGILEFEPSLKSLRKDEYQSVSFVASDGEDFIASFSMKQYTLTESIINIVRTSFVVVVLSMSSIFFT